MSFQYSGIELILEKLTGTSSNYWTIVVTGIISVVACLTQTLIEYTYTRGLSKKYDVRVNKTGRVLHLSQIAKYRTHNLVKYMSTLNSS